MGSSPSSPRRGSVLVGVALTTLCAAPLPAADGGRIVAVGDVHGARQAFAAILRRAGVLDGQDRWAGGSTTLVQTGDFLDRGAGALEVMELLMALERDAPRDGGRVVVLLGNHEALNLLGDLRYVHPATYARLVDPHSEARRLVLCRRAAAAGKRDGTAGEEGRTGLIARCLEAHPPGQIEYLESLAPDARFGRWLRSLPAVARVGEVVFVHGGVSPQLAARGVEGIDRRLAAEITTLDRARRWLIDRGALAPTDDIRATLAAARPFLADGATERDPPPPELEELLTIDDWLLASGEGPLWFRGYARWSDEEGRRELPPILDALGARHVVAGHTPAHDGTIRARFGGLALLIDTGMLASTYPGGRPAALEIEAGRFTALYLDGAEVLLGPPPATAGAANDGRPARGSAAPPRPGE